MYSDRIGLCIVSGRFVCSVRVGLCIVTGYVYV